MRLLEQNLTQVFPLYAAVCPELTAHFNKGPARKTRRKRMANGILKQLNQSLEITVQDGLDGLADFTLQLAYAASGAHFEILSIDEATKTSPSLRLVDAPIVDSDSQPNTRRRRRG